MKKIIVFLFLIILTLFITTAQTSPQMCEDVLDCTEPICTSTRRTYNLVQCFEGYCDGVSGSWQCIIGSCGALCDEDTTCNCPDDYCDGFDLIDYPENGRCGTSGEEACLCQVSEETGGDCEPRIIGNHPDCMAQICEQTSTTECVSDGNAEITYEWNYLECGPTTTETVQDPSCSCLYSQWQNIECVSNGFTSRQRYEITDFDYCEDILYDEVPLLICACRDSETNRECVSDGFADVSYDWNYDYCGNPYTEIQADPACSCVYDDWADVGCISDGFMQQQKTEQTIFSYCQDNLYQEVPNPICSCSYQEYDRQCISDGQAEVYYEWNYGYCGSSFSDTIKDNTCDCIYTEWQDQECVEYNQRLQTRFELSGYEYCEESLSQIIEDPRCDVVGNDTIGVGIEVDNFCPQITDVSYSVDPNINYLDPIDNKNSRSYAFEGETVEFNVTVLDKDGIEQDCTKVFVTLDNGVDPIQAGCVLDHTIDDNTGVFHCIYTVEPRHQQAYGNYWISAIATDDCGSGCSDQAAGIIYLWLNPEVSLTIESQADFGLFYDLGGDILDNIIPGDIVYTPYFTVENTAQPGSGLYLMLEIYGEDMYDYSDSSAICPDSNVLTIDNVQYRALHLNIQQPWTIMPRNYANREFIFDDIKANFLGIGDDITMRLRLNIPSPCKGNFQDGGQIVFVGNVI